MSVSSDEDSPPDTRVPDDVAGAPDTAEAPVTRRRGPLDIGFRVALGVLLVAAVAACIVLAAGGGVEEKGESLTAETVEAGQCVDIAKEQGRIDITEASCGRDHDAEIVLTTDFSDAFKQPADIDDAEALCPTLMDPADVARLAERDLTWGLLIDEPNNIDGYDRLVCYVQAADGRLDEALLG